MLRERHLEAKGYLRSRDGYRLHDRRDELVAKLRGRVKAEAERLRESCTHPGVGS